MMDEKLLRYHEWMTKRRALSVLNAYYWGNDPGTKALAEELVLDYPDMVDAVSRVLSGEFPAKDGRMRSEWKNRRRVHTPGPSEDPPPGHKYLVEGTTHSGCGRAKAYHDTGKCSYVNQMHPPSTKVKTVRDEIVELRGLSLCSRCVEIRAQ